MSWLRKEYDSSYPAVVHRPGMGPPRVVYEQRTVRHRGPGFFDAPLAHRREFGGGLWAHGGGRGR